MGAPRKQDWREVRRYCAWELKQQGWKQQDIAQALGVTVNQPSANGSNGEASKESQPLRVILGRSHNPSWRTNSYVPC